VTVGRLDGKVALISGSARGQGEAEARLFAAEGARVVVSDVRDDLGAAVAADLGERAVYAHLEVTDEDGWRAAVDLALTTFGRLDVLVNNAGVGHDTVALGDLSIDDYRRVFEINAFGTYLGMRAVAPVMAGQGGGSIVNISSIDGLTGIATLAPYAGSKHAVTGMTRSAALELGRQGIRVNSVHPGVISSPMVEAVPEERLARMRVWLDHQPLPRMGTPQEVAYLVLFLASDESSYCTGAQFVIDGGHLAGPWRNYLD
jgi:3alpha(or 20beta)-hydroxysteroid dehydrogenase